MFLLDTVIFYHVSAIQMCSSYIQQYTIVSVQYRCVPLRYSNILSCESNTDAFLLDTVIFNHVSAMQVCSSKIQ